MDDKKTYFDLFKLISWRIVLMVAFLMGLFYYILDIIAKFDYVLFHTLAELISIVCAIIIVVIVFTVWKYIKENIFIAIIGVSFLFVAIIDTVHTLSYSGMPFFLIDSNNITIQFWIFARYLQAFSLLAATFFASKKIIANLYYLFLIYIPITILGLASILLWKNFPNAYINDSGLTNFKIVSEYIIICVFIISLYFIFKNVKNIKGKNFYYLILFIIIQILSEFSFTRYNNLQAFWNFIGHYFKIVSILLFTMVIIRMALDSPNMVLFSKLKSSESKLKYFVYNDSLTNIHNRRKFDEDIESFEGNSILPISYIMGDINGLKFFNDSFGHEIGDQLLISVAEALKNNVRNYDSVYRLGGDEFVIVLPKTPYNDAETISKNLTKIIGNIQIQNINLSISFGVSTKSDKNQKISQLFKIAEDSMYQVKSSLSSSRLGEGFTAIINSLFEKSPLTEAHSRRVSKLSVAFSSVIGLSRNETLFIERTALLHDIGKIGISEEILNKKTKLTKDEYEKIKEHPRIGFRIAKAVKSLGVIDSIILSHHERWDGLGYPDGLSKMNIPYFSRILSICDAVDAMTTERPYKNILSFKETKQELLDGAGTQFDPDLVKIFVDNFDNILECLIE